MVQTNLRLRSSEKNCRSSLREHVQSHTEPLHFTQCTFRGMRRLGLSRREQRMGDRPRPTRVYSDEMRITSFWTENPGGRPQFRRPLLEKVPKDTWGKFTWVFKFRYSAPVWEVGGGGCGDSERCCSIYSGEIIFACVNQMVKKISILNS